MREGLNVVISRGTSYNWVRIAWCRRNGDDWDLYNARVIKYQGAKSSWASLAVGGPASDTKLLDTADESVWHPHILRPIKANEKKWAKECPKPEGWEVESP